LADGGTVVGLPEAEDEEEEEEDAAADETGERAALAPPAGSTGSPLPVTVYSWEHAADSNATVKPISPT